MSKGRSKWADMAAQLARPKPVKIRQARPAGLLPDHRRKPTPVKLIAAAAEVAAETRKLPRKPFRKTKKRVATKPGEGTLAALVDRYAVARALAAPSRTVIDVSVGQIDCWHGAPVRLVDLTPELFNAFLRAAAERPRAKPRTVRNRRAAILAVWQWAYDEGFAPHKPARLRRENITLLHPSTLTARQFAWLIDAGDRERGFFQESGLRVSAFWRAFLTTARDTGLPMLRLLDVRRGNLRGEKLTVDGIAFDLSSDTVAAIDATFPPERNRIFAAPWGDDHLRARYRRLAESAGIVKGGAL